MNFPVACLDFNNPDTVDLGEKHSRVYFMDTLFYGSDTEWFL